MTIEIIGQAPPKHQRTCGKCGAIMKFDPIDVKSFIHHDYGGGSERVYQINCPRCSNQILLSYKEAH